MNEILNSHTIRLFRYHGRTLFFYVGMVLCTGDVFGEDSESEPTRTPNKSQYTVFNPTFVDLRRLYNTDRPSKTDSLSQSMPGSSKLKAMCGIGRWTSPTLNAETNVCAHGLSVTATLNSA